MSSCRQRLGRLDRRGRPRARGASVRFERAPRLRARDERGAPRGGRRRGAARSAPTASSRRASSRPRGRGSASPAWASVAPKLVRTTGPDEADRLDLIDTAGMVVDRRRKNGLVGPRAPRAGVRRARRGVRRRRRGRAVPARGARRVRGRRARSSTRTSSAGRPTPTWRGGRACSAGGACTSRGAVAYHIRSYRPSTRAVMPEPDRRMQFRNRYLMIAKNDPGRDLLRDLPWIVAVRGAGAGPRPAARAPPAARLPGGRAPAAAEARKRRAPAQAARAGRKGPAGSGLRDPLRARAAALKRSACARGRWLAWRP